MQGIMPWWRTKDVLDLCGLSWDRGYRQIQYWAQQGLVLEAKRVSGGHGGNRLYDPPAAMLAAVVHELRTHKVSLQRLRAVIPEVMGALHEIGSEDKLDEVSLVVVGRGGWAVVQGSFYQGVHGALRTTKGLIPGAVQVLVAPIVDRMREISGGCRGHAPEATDQDAPLECGTRVPDEGTPS